MELPAPRPAHETKELALLSYPLFPSAVRVELHQDASLPDSTGRTVWLGAQVRPISIPSRPLTTAQVLSIYLQHLKLKPTKLVARQLVRKRVIDLGSGTGLLSLQMLHLGFNSLATDLATITLRILAANLRRNTLEGRKGVGVEVGGDGGARIKAATLDWTHDPDAWDFQAQDVTPVPPSFFEMTPARTSPASETNVFEPPFDLILTSDSLYHPSLLQPLLSTLQSLSLLSTQQGTKPLIYLALENRDPLLIAQFWTLANDRGFKCSRVDPGRLVRILEADYPAPEGGIINLGWMREEWDGVEIWKMSLR